MLGNVWTQVLSRIETKVDQRSFRTWFEPTALVADQGEKVTVRVPSVLCRDWLAKHYANVISEAAVEIDRHGLQIAFVIDDPNAPSTIPERRLRIRLQPLFSPQACRQARSEA